MADATIVKTIVMAASRETVWGFLTNKDKLAEWFHPAANDLAAGEDYALLRDGERVCWGRVEAMDPPARLVTTFTVKPLDGVMTTVTWTLDEVMGGTKLTMEHRGLEAAGDALGLLQALDAGWDAHLKGLREAA